MSSGVGIVAVIAGSLPRIAGPRPAAPEADAPPAPRSAKPASASKKPPSVSPLPHRVRAERPVATSSRPAPSAAAPVAGRSESVDIVRAGAPKELVRRIADAVQAAPVRDAFRIRLSLRPAHLGDLRIELSVAGSRLRARVRTETEAARNLILAHLDELRRALEERGIRVGGFQVDVKRPGRDEEATERRGGDRDAGDEESGPRSHRRQRIDVRA